jgi:hypothetical protein
MFLDVQANFAAVLGERKLFKSKDTRLIAKMYAH